MYFIIFLLERIMYINLSHYETFQIKLESFYLRILFKYERSVILFCYL